jgi:hypothetical protein
MSKYLYKSKYSLEKIKIRAQLFKLMSSGLVNKDIIEKTGLSEHIVTYLRQTQS